MIETLKRYALKRIEILKIEAIEKSSLSAGMLTFIIIILVACAFFLILFNFGIAFLVGKELNNYACGFLVVAAFYLLLMTFIVILKKWIINSIANKVIRIFNQ